MRRPFCIVLLHPLAVLSRKALEMSLGVYRVAVSHLFLGDEPERHRFVDSLPDETSVYMARLEQIQNGA